MRFLLRFITVFEAATSDHKIFRKKLKLDWRNSFLKSKKANEGKSLHRAHFMRGHGDCQAIDGEFSNDEPIFLGAKKQG